MVSFKKLAVPCLCLLILFGCEFLGLFRGMNDYFYDLAFRLRGPRTPSDRILIVAIDEETLARLGPWPLKRRHYAAALEKMGAAADVVGIDIVMSEASPDDLILSEAIRKMGAVVLPILINEGLDLEFPTPALALSPAGHVHIERGIDGVVREVYHVLSFQGRDLPSFSSRIYELARKRLFPRSPLAPERHDEAGGSIRQGEGRRINYYGGPNAFPRISFVDVVQGAYPADYFQGRIALIGVAALGLVDSSMTPFSESRMGTPGVEIQAHILQNLLAGETIEVVPRGGRWALSLVVALGLYFFFLKTTEGAAVAVLLASLILYALGTFWLFAQWRLWSPPSLSFVSFGVLLVAAYVLKLREATASLAEIYKSIWPHLRGLAKEYPRHSRLKLLDAMTPGGIQRQALMLQEITHQLVFEKELSDRILLSDMFGVAVFAPDRRLALVNRDMRQACEANGISLQSRDEFVAALAPHVLEKGRGGEEPPLETMMRGASSTISLNRPGKRYLKVSMADLPVAERRYALFILADITRVKELEILKSQIVSIVSHELKTPMTNIQGFSELLAEGLEGEMGQYASVIREESERLTRFVNTFLDINRLEEGRQRIAKIPVPLSELLRRVAVKMQPVAKGKGIALRAELPGEPGPVAMIDRDLAEQAVLNLAENACKYSPPGSEVTLRLSERPEAAVIEVIDNGPGIRAADLERIFEKFYRANAETAEDVKGSGLGLAFVKQAVEAQGGQIGVTSVFGEGAIFSIVFPREDGSQPFKRGPSVLPGPSPAYRRVS